MQLTAGSHQNSPALLVGNVAWQCNMTLHQGLSEALGLPLDTAGTLVPAGGAGKVLTLLGTQVIVPAVHSFYHGVRSWGTSAGWRTSSTAPCEAICILTQVLAT